jgi:CBS-domain-containing membrane protein
MALNVGSIASRIVVVAEPRTPVTKVAQLMRENHIGAVIVIEDAPPSNRPIGIITDRDLVVEVLAMDVDYRSLTASDVMTSNPTTVRETDAIFDAVEIMQRTGVRRLPVIDNEDRLVAILTFDDVIEILAQELGDLAKTIRREQKREERARK